MLGPPAPAPAGPSVSADCLDEAAALSYVQAEANSRDAEVQHHIQLCSRCRVLISEAARKPFPHDDSPAGSWQRTLDEGDRLCDRYRVVRFIARGGMGEVYEVEDELLRVRVAVKTLVASAVDNPTAFSRLRAEVVLARTVIHRNVCRLISLEVHERRDDRRVTRVPFIVMELLEGETLRAVVRRDGPMAEDRALPIVRQMVAGLAAIHAADVLHRDFKSENVMLVPEGEGTRVVVMDFGLARPLLLHGDRSFSSGVAVGTLDYMAPEQALGRTLTPAVDVYSLGIVLFETLTGHLPYAPSESISRLVPHSPPRASAGHPGITRTWDDVIHGCLATEPAARPSSVTDVLERLESSGAGASSPPRRRRILTMAAVTASIVAAGAAVVHQRSKAQQATTNVQRGRAAIATTDGSPEDWEPLSRGAFELPGRVYCLEPLGENRVGIIWGQPRRADVLDLQSRVLTPWNLPANALLADDSLHEAWVTAMGCPRVSPDGKRLAFEGSTKEGERGVFVAPLNDAADARFVSRGRRPRWDPNDSHRLTLLMDDLHVVVANTQSGKVVASAASNAQIPWLTSAMFSSDAPQVLGTGSGTLWFFGANDLKLAASMPWSRQAASSLVAVSAAGFDVLNNSEHGQFQVFRTDATGATQPSAAFADGHIWVVESTGRDHVVAAGWDRVTVRPLRGSATQAVAIDGPVYHEADANTDGDVAVTTYRGNSIVVDLYPRGHSSGRQLFAGTGGSPFFTEDGTAVVLGTYTPGAGDSVTVCSLSGSCKHLTRAPSIDMPSVSPSGRQVAYIDYRNAGTVVVVDIATQSETRLTPRSMDCAPRWLNDRIVWIATASDWMEMDVVDKRPTGRVIPRIRTCGAATHGPQGILAERAVVEHHTTARVFVRPGPLPRPTFPPQR